MSIMQPLNVKYLGTVDYQATWEKMRAFTDARDESTTDELWLLEHPPVFTQGQAGKPEHVLNPGDIPIIQTDRGGQITYHGPGQLVAYPLMNLRRQNQTVRSLVCNLEQSVINTLAKYQINASRKENAPGIYVDGAKICSLGIRVRRGCTYHGIAFNIDMQLEPFSRINPCGFANLAVTQVSDLHTPPPPTITQVTTDWLEQFCAVFNYQLPVSAELQVTV